MPTSNDTEADVQQAAESTFIGLFRVPLDQMLPHPKQRLLNLVWVEDLREKIENKGLDRVGFPVRGILTDRHDIDEATLEEARKATKKVLILPSHLRIHVFDGQHRLEAYQRMTVEDDKATRFWFAKIYKKRLETDHPAEFLTLIHGANEVVPKLPVQDADRFLALFELRQLLENRRISKAQFDTNKDRLQAPDVEVRRGINNLIRHESLRNAVYRALQYPYIRVHFRAPSWRKLTTGHFYQLAADLVDEMVYQSKFVVHDWLNPPSNILGARARLCTVEKLHGLKDKKNGKHPWASAEGGISGVLDRYSAGRRKFCSKLKHKKEDPWSLPDVVDTDTICANKPSCGTTAEGHEDNSTTCESDQQIQPVLSPLLLN
ncbi:hypothetical protein RSAG8_07200, partial [Rhizoctonia solani AG-8 WAC10335]